MESLIMMNKRKNYYSFVENVEKARIMRNINGINLFLFYYFFEESFTPKPWNANINKKKKNVAKLKYCTNTKIIMHTVSPAIRTAS